MNLYTLDVSINAKKYYVVAENMEKALEASATVIPDLKNSRHISITKIDDDIFIQEQAKEIKL